MLNSKILLAAVARVEPSLTDAVMRERPAADRESVRVASFAALTTAVLALLNSVGPPPASLRAVIDATIAELPTLVNQTTVRIDQVILDPTLAAHAKSQLFGADATNSPTALSLAYNLCGQVDIQRMLLLNKGPFGQVGGIAAVLSERLLGPENAADLMLEATSAVNALCQLLTAPAKQPPLPASQRTGCAVAFLGLLVGGFGSAAAVVHYIV